MSRRYPYHEGINLHVPGRISRSDAQRQDATARAILRRLEDQPGVILADEVGMGKTFVALAAACSVAWTDPRHRPVVVMVPPSLRQKWPRDFELFREKCLPPEMAARLEYQTAERGLQFLKRHEALQKNRRRSLIFVTHGALSRGLADPWTKLALIRQALHHRKHVHDLRRALVRHMGTLLRVNSRLGGQWPEFWEAMLSTPPDRWMNVLRRYGIDAEGGDDSSSPVPQAVLDVLPDMDLTELFAVLYDELPRKRGAHFTQRMKRARRQVNQTLREAWTVCLQKLQLKLPLLILDEAHHAKNPHTRLASLFQLREAQDDAEVLAKGPLGGAFERMLFLTATPFQLGHHELCSVLERFGDIAWRVKAAPTMGRKGYHQRLAELRRRLDAAQQAAVTLDNAWGRLRASELGIESNTPADVEAWWRDMQSAPEQQPTSVRAVLSAYVAARQRMREAEQALQPWVIRHQRSRRLEVADGRVPRRRELPGRAILHDRADDEQGLSVEGEALLPFLLAARAAVCNPDERPLFAEGLASSYEAFLHTSRHTGRARNGGNRPVDADDEAIESRGPAGDAKWYLDHLQRVLPEDGQTQRLAHPKLHATVQRVMNAWRHREKVVIFCHYIATGRVLRRRISEAIRREISQRGAAALGCEQDQALRQLERIGARFFDERSPLRRASQDEVRRLLAEFSGLAEHEEALIEIIRRNLRTPSVLVRYFPLQRPKYDADAVAEAMLTRDGSGLSLADLLRGFFEFLSERCGTDERQRYIAAMKRVQTGSHADRAVTASFDRDELQGSNPDTLLPDVRLVNGDVRQDTRQRLMLTFNTPFYPDVLVASSVMAEGVDLHLSCRYVVHHDLCWNPSTLEQRTGRIDRIGAKVERAGEPIHAYLPYIAQTQDEKMYRVVMDRQRWFSVVMGEQFRTDTRTTDRLAERVPLPATIATELRFRLETDHREPDDCNDP